MIPKIAKPFLFLILFVSAVAALQAQSPDKIMVVIIDGARYSETLGDPTHRFTPQMWSLAQQGTTISNFANNNYTYTSRAIPALWCGAWTDVQNINYQGSDTQQSVLPTIFEYYRKDKKLPSTECYSISKYLPSLWRPSYDPDYGESYWPAFQSVGSNDSDAATQTQVVMDRYHPHFLWVYLDNVDHEGHSGDWSKYTRAIFIADSIVGVLWAKLQADPFYRNSTTLIVTNDHGRHDDQHGGFQGHGCSCDGCRHIQFLAVGPSIKQNYVSTQYRTIPDMVVTASFLLGVNPAKATGSVMHEIFTSTGIAEESNQDFQLKECSPNPFINSTSIRYFLSKPSDVQLSIHSVSGERITLLKRENQNVGLNSIEWDGTNNQGLRVNSGIYFYRLQVGNQSKAGQLIFSRTAH
ncbi:T9SS type A sorting domain-containing protein [Williamwhitmania taraxaci]|uniref:Por secretion system C-terminal sorting domain-containing protein n=1 Tax=Williamwhitmania taraxaci TaxID=1640674 RepID=A0A1G6MIN3_9BACT|nr:T9SS type A sorting domain-containing protein [Williamwhitmania taraxaci]SDC55383.1 Por secretion system C-terminal sorting domain-containing protein [Williamwhitmania taraxaci]